VQAVKEIGFFTPVKKRFCTVITATVMKKSVDRTNIYRAQTAILITEYNKGLTECKPCPDEAIIFFPFCW